MITLEISTFSPCDHVRTYGFVSKYGGATVYEKCRGGLVLEMQKKILRGHPKTMLTEF